MCGGTSNWGVIGHQWSDCSKVRHEVRGGMLANEDELGQRFISGYIRAGASWCEDA